MDNLIERQLFEESMPGYKAMLRDNRASELAGHRVEQPSNMFRAWLARAALSKLSTCEG